MSWCDIVFNAPRVYAVLMAYTRCYRLDFCNSSFPSWFLTTHHPSTFKCSGKYSARKIC